MLKQSRRVITISSGRFRVFTRNQIAQAASEILHDGSPQGVRYWVMRTDQASVAVDILASVSRSASSCASIMGNSSRGGIRHVGPVCQFIVMSGDWTSMGPHDTLESHRELTPETIDFAKRLHQKLMHGPRNLDVLRRFLIQVARRQRSFAIVQQKIPEIRLTPDQQAALHDMLRRAGEFD